jgi:hypothetical protein
MKALSELLKKVQVYAGLLGLLMMGVSIIMFIRRQPEAQTVLTIGAGLFAVFVVLKALRRLIWSD